MTVGIRRARPAGPLLPTFFCQPHPTSPLPCSSSSLRRPGSSLGLATLSLQWPRKQDLTGGQVPPRPQQCPTLAAETLCPLAIQKASFRGRLMASVQKPQPGQSAAWPAEWGRFAGPRSMVQPDLTCGRNEALPPPCPSRFFLIISSSSCWEFLTDATTPI